MDALLLLAVVVLGLVALCIKDEGEAALIVIFLALITFGAIAVVGFGLDLDPMWLFDQLGVGGF